MSRRLDNNINFAGSGEAPIVFAHGFGCDQSMWKQVAPDFEKDHRVILFDLTGAGQSNRARYDFTRYETLDGHAEDVVEILEELDLRDVTLVGHSVSAMIASLAAISAPDRIARLVLVAPSPCFLNDGDYIGGFEKTDLEGILDLMDENYLGWASQFAPQIAGEPGGGPAADDLTQSFCQTDPDVARHFGRVTFMSDRRADVPRTNRPALILQCSDDLLAPVGVGEWMHRSIEGSTLEVLPVNGHCPHMTAPDLTLGAIRRFLAAAA
eukprot:TRINITY_DN15338_c0_g1_i1.p2 TRINITY_DN15338_c0_g1~~TRINITY_DN15338_c0_g1_i1.p2  ORF type:complete len:267 (-),score=70.09 TRINITY_DN15338_c0_g1_i1:31-831(-)